MDKAGVNLINKLPFSVDVSSKSDNCYKVGDNNYSDMDRELNLLLSGFDVRLTLQCLDIILKTVHQETNRTIVADTTFGVTLYVNDSRTQEHICSTHHHLQVSIYWRATCECVSVCVCVCVWGGNDIHEITALRRHVVVTSYCHTLIQLVMLIFYNVPPHSASMFSVVWSIHC